jgi:hypothetical protein
MATVSGSACRRFEMALKDRRRLPLLRPDGEGAWQAEGVEAVNVAPVGSMSGVRRRSPPGRRCHERPSRRMTSHRAPVVGELAGGVTSRGRSPAALRILAAGQPLCTGHRWSVIGDRVNPLRVRADPCLASAICGQHVAPLHRSGASPTTCRPCGISVYSSSSIRSRRRLRRATTLAWSPRWLRGAEFKLRRPGSWIRAASSSRSSPASSCCARQRSSEALSSCRPL